jgi:hypothetical protein
LRRAKHHYLGSVPAGGFGTYDEKILIEVTLYGLPMYRVDLPDTGLQSLQDVRAEMQGTEGAWRYGSVGAQVGSGSLITTRVSLTPPLEQVTATYGAETVGYYYTVEGDAQSNPGRPVQPRTSVELPEYSGVQPHGALFLSGHGRSESGFDPFISRPVTSTALSEPAYDYPGWYPSKPFAVNRLGENARLVVLPGQYRGDEKEGTERLFEELAFEVYYAPESEEDFLAPSIWEVAGTAAEGGATFQVMAQDGSGVERVVVGYSEDGEQWHTIDLSPNSQSGYWEGDLAGLSGEISYSIQVVDGAGNVSLSANKGLFFALEKHDIYLPVVLRNS